MAHKEGSPTLGEFLQRAKNIAANWKKSHGYEVYVPKPEPNPDGWSGPGEVTVTDALGHVHYYNEQGQEIGYR